MKKGIRQEKTEYRKIPGSLLLALLILICVLGTVQMMARYVRGTSGGSSARVASFQVTSDLSSFEKTIAARVKPGAVQEYTFDLRNDSETAIHMMAYLDSEGNLPLRISYKKGSVSGDGQDSWTVLTENLVEQWETAAGTGSLSWTDKLEAKSGNASYTIRLEWPESENSYRYRQGVLALQLRIEAKQAD